MRRVLVLLSVPVMLACAKEKYWVERYSEGIKKGEKEYYMDGDDSIFTYQRFFYESGQISVEGPLKDNERHGQWRSFYPEGQKWSESVFEKGKSNGEVISFYENGKVRYTGAFLMGEKSGEWIWYDSTGVVLKKTTF